MNKKKQEKGDIQELANKFFMTRSEEDFQNLYNRMYWSLKAYITKNFIKNNYDDCEDVIIGVLEKVWTKIDLYDPIKANFSTWLYKVAMNDSLLFLKGKSRENNKKYDTDISDLYSSLIAKGGADAFIVQEEKECSINDDLGLNKTYYEIVDDFYDASIKCINKLPDNFRLALTEKLINKKSIEQIAYDNQIKKTTIVNWLYQGRQELKKIIKKEHKDLYEDWLISGN